MTNEPQLLKATLNNNNRYCLYCQEKIEIQTSWATLFQVSSPACLCADCLERLEPLPDTRCSSCDRPLLEKNETYCDDCRYWASDPYWHHVLERNRSIFVYNEMMKAFIAKWKYRGDAVLILSFQQKIRKLYLEHYYSFLPVPIPLSSQRLQERGFNQSDLMAGMMGGPLSLGETASLFTSNLLKKRIMYPKTPLPAVSLLERVIHEDKQSKKSRLERLTSKRNPFQVRKGFEQSLKSKNIVLVDDIYTTGSTLRKAAYTLKEHGAKKVCALTLARG